MKLIKMIFCIVAALFSISAISPVLVPFSLAADGNLNTVGYIAGAMFWAGLILGILGYLLLIVFWKKMWKKHDNDNQPKGLSVLRFFSNPGAKIADVIMIVGIAAVIYSMAGNTGNTWAAVISLIMMLGGIYGHFLMNGTIYRSMPEYKKETQKRRKKSI